MGSFISLGKFIMKVSNKYLDTSMGFSMSTPMTLSLQQIYFGHAYGLQHVGTANDIQRSNALSASHRFFYVSTSAASEAGHA